MLIAEYITVENITCLTGILLFGTWLLKTSLGRAALADSPPRRNNMPLYLPFIPLFIWFGGISLALPITRELLPDLPDWQSVLIDNILLCTGALATMAVVIFLARASFARRLKGFGLNFKTIYKDFPAAFVNLLSVWPIVMAAIIVTTFFGNLIWGQEFEMQKHQELKLITAYPQLPVRILIIITTVAVVPAFEEMLFRGLFQTMIRSFFRRTWPGARAPSHETRNGACPVRSEFPSQTGPASVRTSNGAWPSIVITSFIFAVVHYDPGHWPALFALSMCMGYAYEKSGSLFRPIFIHSLFNATSVIATLYSG